MSKVVQPIEWTPAGVVMIDQRRLPAEVVRHTYTDYQDVAAAIRDMVIRGAPAIGVAAAMGIALGVLRSKAASVPELRVEFPLICDAMARTRPTAVDLFWAIDRLKRRFEELAAASDLPAIRQALVAEARLIHEEKRAIDEAIGRFGAALMPQSGQVMTQCNAGALATAGIGTALGVIRVAVEQGRKLRVFVPETRPYLQGARLTAWELAEGGIPLTLITDNMVGHFLKTGKIGAVVVGADRIAANGDTANKIGTYQMAVLARENNVPFYVAAPLSHFGSLHCFGRQHSHRGAPCRGGHALPRRSHRARRRSGPSRLRRHSGAPDHRHHHRTRRRFGALSRFARAPVRLVRRGAGEGFAPPQRPASAR